MIGIFRFLDNNFLSELDASLLRNQNSLAILGLSGNHFSSLSSSIFANTTNLTQLFVAVAVAVAVVVVVVAAAAVIAVAAAAAAVAGGYKDGSKDGNKDSKDSKDSKDKSGNK